MESLKPILLLIVLGGVGYGVYVALNHAPPAEGTRTNAPLWNKPAADEPAAAARASNTDARSTSTSSPDRPWSRPVGGTNTPSGANSIPANSTTATGGASPTSAPSISLPFGLGSSSIQSAPSSNPSNNPSAASQPMNNSPPPLTAAPGMESGSAAVETGPSSADGMARHECAAAMRSAETMAKSGKLVEALRELSKWFSDPAVSPEDQTKLNAMLSQLAGTVIYSKQHWLASPYVVSAGESLETIAQQCQVPWQLLAKINGIDQPTAVVPGEELKVIRGPFTAQLNCGQDCLTLFVDGLYAGRFPVQGGRTLAKPEGSYAVAKFQAEDPANTTRRPYIILGGDLQLRIPDDSGAAPPGTVGISPRDMNDVFDMLSSRSEVTIRR